MTSQVACTHHMLVKSGFFNTALADVFRAVSGKCYPGSFTLLLCAVAALAEIEWCTNNQTNVHGPHKDGDTFRAWVQQFVVDNGVNPSLDPVKLYALRCALVHSYGYAGAMKAAGFEAYNLTIDRPLHHTKLQTDSRNVIWWQVNLESLIADITIAAYQFFEDLESRWQAQLTDDLKKMTSSLILPLSLDVTGQIAGKNPGLAIFEFIQPDLAFLDDLRTCPTHHDIIQSVHQIYLANGDCHCGEPIKMP